MQMLDCTAWLRARDGFLLVTHLRPDGDTLGSAAALCLALRRAGKTAWLYPNPEITESYRCYTDALLAPDGFVPETVVSVDLADTNLFPVGFQGNVDLCIDHHPSNTFYAGETLVRPERAACGEIMLELIQALLGSITREEADLLYVAVSTDTGCFLYGNTTADTHRCAAALIDAGADSKALNKQLFRTVSKARLQLEGMVYTGLRSYRHDQINIAVVTLDMMARAGATEDDCNDLASLAGKVAGSKVSVTVRELGPERCKISLRTGAEVNASEVCARFGGGGHAMAAGCEMDCTPDEAAERMLAAINEVWP